MRPTEGGLVLQQLLYADEIRLIADLGIDLVVVSDAELKLAQQLIEPIQPMATSQDSSSTREEKNLAAVEGKIAGQQVIAPAHAAEPFAR